MKDYHFYLEYPTAKDRRAGTRKNPGNHSGTVVVVFTDRETQYRSGNDWMYECISSVQDTPDGAVCSGSASYGYLRERCKRISEKLAREIHPTLFHYLDQQNDKLN